MTRAHAAPRNKRRRRRSGTAKRARLRGAWRALRIAPQWVQIAVGVVVIVSSWAVMNWVYQVIRKPAELFFPVSGALSKLPSETWQRYESIFRQHATATITPDFLAALAQVESAGNPVARTYWRWYATWDLFELYRPASSAVGMYQITNATFVEAKRLCIHNHNVVEDGPWHQPRSCWFNGLYARVIPSHAVEMTSALLDRGVASALARRGATRATLAQRQELAAIIHLCGANAGEGYVARGFRLGANQRCGDHDVRRYLAAMTALKREFARWL